MSEFCILDDVFVGGPKSFKKHSTVEVLGLKNPFQNAHQRFYSKQFIPFIAQRDVNGKLIQNYQQIENNHSQNNASKSTQNIHSNLKENLHSLRRTSMIDSRFKLHQISHQKGAQSKFHKEKRTQFKEQVAKLQKKNYEKKYKNETTHESVWLTKFHDNNQINNVKLNNEHQISNNHRLSFGNLQTNQAIISSNQINKKKYKQRQTKSSKIVRLKQPKLILPSSKSLLKLKPNQNPELQQIERQARVHYNHPELERLKQSKKLTLNILDDFQKGDKLFRKKVEEFRIIKERIKKQMGKY